MLRRAAFACAVAAACAAAPARADPAEELERLRAESAQMHRALDALDARIRALEGGTQGAPGARARADASPLADLRRGWSQVERGLAAERVEALLGSPDKLLRIDGSVVWYYAYPGLGHGSVFFDAGGKVSSAQPPSAGWAR